MPLCIMYFNLKDNANEEEFVKKLKEFYVCQQGKVKGLGSWRLYRHYGFGANPRLYQLHIEFKDFATWDRFLALDKSDAQSVSLFQEWRNLMDLTTHCDEFVREIPL